ncbi:hypothetical protein B0H13DRAFT_2369285 [Mycena leptocephala]|nr:hypothetical protein B0H13DRAFT_2369285 [Mycena leptocephala]
MTRGNAKTLFTTLAYQLAIHRRELRHPISQGVERDPTVLARAMDVQLQTLIAEPCQLLEDLSPPVLLIDGLVECEGHDIQRRILRLIASAANGYCVRPRILIASRPEPHIRETFAQGPFRGRFDSTNIEQSFEDVRTYCTSEMNFHALIASIPHDGEHSDSLAITPDSRNACPKLVRLLHLRVDSYQVCRR